MLNDLLKSMATDMNIKRYEGESDISFSYRLIFSALGQWCLRSAASENHPITKHAQTLLLNNLVKSYLDYLPELTNAFSFTAPNFPVSVLFRKVYEETGYLITNSDNNNLISNMGKGIDTGAKYLFFGINDPATISGLGVFVDNVSVPVTWREVLIRDSLVWKEYLSRQYDVTLFNIRDIDIEELQFFDPKLSSSPSSSWKSYMATEKSIARKSPDGPFFKVMKYEDELLFCEEPQNEKPDELISYEYRRLYFALKKYYHSPIIAKINRLDKEYSEVTINGYLPNREYYLLLLCAWPDKNFDRKNKFIIRNSLINFIKEIFENIAIKVEGE